MKKIFNFLFVFPLLTLLVTGSLCSYYLFFWSNQNSDLHFSVHPGEGFFSINSRLKESDLIKSEKIFFRYVKYKELLLKFKSGTFLIPAHSKTSDIIRILTEGRPISVTVTIPEGKNIFEIGKLLERSGITTYESFIKMARNTEFLSQLQLPYPSVEGYLFPDTYHFSPKMAPQHIIKHLIRNQRKRVSQLDFSQTDLSPHKVIILASIVEKETGAGHERPMIAGVFHNRLKKGMRLQSDPTTIYGIYENFNGNLTRKHLTTKTEYNTYKMSGLPLGPIANPGVAAIKAVLEPARHKYLYFVSKNDGTHHFSETYSEHLRYVEHFQKNSLNRVGKSWRDLAQESSPPDSKVKK